MKTVRLKVYTINELAPKAKESALNQIRNTRYFPWGDEYAKTFEAFCEGMLGANIKHNRTEQTIDLSNFTDEQLELSGIRLMKFIWNNYKSDLYKGKYYSKWINGECKSRRSKVIFAKDCNLTGFCADFDILKPMYEFLEKPINSTTLENLITLCKVSFETALENDIEYHDSDEALIEHCLENDILFTANGQFFNL